MNSIVQDIRNGNKELYRTIVREYGDDLLRVAYHFVRDWDEAKDITQQTFIRCYETLNRYNPEQPFRPWLYRIHLNLCKSTYRSLRRKLIRFASLDESHAQSSASDETGDYALILGQVHKLPGKQKAAFVLVEIEEYSQREAAELLGCAESTLRVHLARAKQKLRTRLSQLGIGYE